MVPASGFFVRGGGGGGWPSDLQQMGWLPSTIFPFLASFIAISSYLEIVSIFCDL